LQPRLRPPRPIIPPAPKLDGPFRRAAAPAAPTSCRSSLPEAEDRHLGTMISLPIRNEGPAPGGPAAWRSPGARVPKRPRLRCRGRGAECRTIKIEATFPGQRRVALASDASGWQAPLIAQFFKSRGATTKHARPRFQPDRHPAEEIGVPLLVRRRARSPRAPPGASRLADAPAKLRAVPQKPVGRVAAHQSRSAGFRPSIPSSTARQRRAPTVCRPPLVEIVRDGGGRSAHPFSELAVTACNHRTERAVVAGEGALLERPVAGP